MGLGLKTDDITNKKPAGDIEDFGDLYIYQFMSRAE